MVVITTPNFLKALDTLNNLGPNGSYFETERQLRQLTNLEPYIYIFLYKALKLLIIYDRSVVFQQMKMLPIGNFPTNENQTRYLAQLDTNLLHVRSCKNCNPFLDSVIFRLLKIELSKNNNLIFYFSKISIISKMYFTSIDSTIFYQEYIF